MKNVYLPLPRVGFDTIKKIIIDYHELNRSVTIAEIAEYSNSNESRYSKAHAFLEKLGIIKGRDAKIITELGSNLGAALKYNQVDDIKTLWTTIIENGFGA